MICERRLSAIVACLAMCLATTTAVAGTWSEISVAQMQVELFVPDALPRSAAGRPLMVNLHGCQQTGDLFRERGNWEATAEEFGMIVALPTVPNGGKIAGCWDYFGKPSILTPAPRHTRQNRDNDNVLALVDRLLGDQTLGVDPKQVYLSGLSSGGGETMVLGCLAPDVFAGIGIVAGPSLGTGANEIGPPPPVSRDQVLGLCKSLAGANAEHLATQVTSVAFGTKDATVNQAYNRLNAEAMAEIYGATPSGTFDLSGLPGFQPQGQGSLWSDTKGPRVSLVQITGMGHAWPAGSGPGTERNFIASRGPDYPAFLTKFLTDNNRRLAPPQQKPRLTAEATVDQTASTVRISGEASAADGPLDALRLELVGLSEPTFQFGPVTIPQPSPPSFAFASGPLPTNASYKAAVRARKGEAEAVAEVVFGVGPNPPFPPVLGEVMSSVSGSCVALFGSVEDQNGNLDRVLVAIDGNAVEGAMLNAARNSWTLGQPGGVCMLQPGRHEVVVTAVDLGGLQSEPAQIDVEIPVPFVTVTDTLNGHVIAQRVRFYPQAGHFGTADEPFTTLVMQHGSLTPFPLFGIDGVFFANRPASNASGATPSVAGLAAVPSVEGPVPSSDPLTGFLDALVSSGVDVSINISRPRDN